MGLDWLVKAVAAVAVLLVLPLRDGWEAHGAPTRYGVSGGAGVDRGRLLLTTRRERKAALLEEEALRTRVMEHPACKASGCIPPTGRYAKLQEVFDSKGSLPKDFLPTCHVDLQAHASAVAAAPQYEHPKLTRQGREVRTVVVAAMVGFVCQSDDWRGDLPRYLARTLPKARVIKWHSRGTLEEGAGTQCSYCTPLEHPRDWEPRRLERDAVSRYILHASGKKRTMRKCKHRGPASRWPCDKFWDSAGVDAADVLVIIGTGRAVEGCPEGMVKPSGACQLRHDDPERFPSLAELAKMPFIGPDTLTVHIPVRRVEFVMENMMGYDHVIADESFIKPLQDGSIQDMKHCHEVDKVNDLIYVGRYEPVRNAKGQLAFLQRVDPRLLEGFTVHFYGANPETGLPETLERIGRERNVSVVAHSPSSKQELLAHVCRSKGQLHYAMEDDNPRAAYEGIYAGNPLFVSQESNIALELFDHPFVVKTMFHKGDINVDLAIYMEMVRGADAAFHRRIASWAEDAMVGDKVYLEMCQRIGLCAHTSESRAKLKEMTVKWEADRQRQLRLLEEEKEAVEYAEL